MAADLPQVPDRSELLRDRRVLVVEDDPTVREVTCDYLRNAGFIVDEAADGIAALRRMEATPADLIVLDVMLPDLDGFEVCRRLRQDGVRTPVVFLTAKDGTEDKVRGLTLGGDDYLIKPFSLEELVARINAVLRRESGAVISPSEFANANKQYFVQPNDKPGNIAQKARNRQLAIEGVLNGVPVNKRGLPSLTNPAGAGGGKNVSVDY